MAVIVSHVPGLGFIAVWGLAFATPYSRLSMLVVRLQYKDTSLIRNNPPNWDHHMTLHIGLL